MTTEQRANQYRQERQSKILKLYTDKDVDGLYKFFDEETRKAFGRGAQFARRNHDAEEIQES